MAPKPYSANICVSVPCPNINELLVSFSCAGSVTCRKAAEREGYRATEKAVRLTVSMARAGSPATTADATRTAFASYPTSMHAATCSGKRRTHTHRETVQTSRLLLLLYLLDGVLSSLHVHDAAADVGEPTKRDGGHPQDDHALACIKYPADGPSAASAHPSQPLPERRRRSLCRARRVGRDSIIPGRGKRRADAAALRLILNHVRSFHPWDARTTIRRAPCWQSDLRRECRSQCGCSAGFC